MIRPIEGEALAKVLRRMCGRTAYLHMEVTPGGFVRNLATHIEEAVLRNDGPTYRVALRCGGGGWVIMEGLTHMGIDEGEPLELCTVAELDRLTRVLVISEEVLAA